MRSYTAEIQISSVTAAKTLLLLEAPSDCVLRIDGAYISNANQDANEQLLAGLFRVTTKGSPAGTSVTPEKKDQGDPASGVTVLGDLTAEPTTYASVAHHRAGFSNLAGFIFEPVMGAEVYVGPSGLVGLYLIDAPSAGFKCVASIEFTELGG